MQVVVVMVLLFERIQGYLVVLPLLYGAVGHCVGHYAELAQEDLPQEQVDPWVQDLVEGGHADRREKKVAVQVGVPAGGAAGGRQCRVALVGGHLGGDHLQHQTLRREAGPRESCHRSTSTEY